MNLAKHRDSFVDYSSDHHAYFQLFHYCPSNLDSYVAVAAPANWYISMKKKKTNKTMNWVVNLYLTLSEVFSLLFKFLFDQCILHNRLRVELKFAWRRNALWNTIWQGWNSQLLLVSSDRCLQIQLTKHVWWQSCIVWCLHVWWHTCVRHSQLK